LDNPFKSLRDRHYADKLLDEGFEEVDGPMQCQTADCREAVPEGLYSAELKVLTWKCSQGHVSRLENFVA